MILSWELLQSMKKVAVSGLYEIKELGWNFNLQAISSSGRSGGWRTSDEKFVSTKTRRSGGRRHRAEERLWEQIFRVSDHHVQKKHTHMKQHYDRPSREQKPVD